MLIFLLLFGPNFREAKVSERGKLPQGGAPCSCGRKPEHFHTFCNTIIYSNGGKHLESVTNSYAAPHLEKDTWLPEK